MSFATSIQALLGANTPHNQENVQSAPDWLNMLDYIWGPHPTLPPGNTYLAIQNMNDGTELNSQDGTAYFSGGAFHDYPVGRDTAGNVYLSSLGGIAQINSTTLAQTQTNPSIGYPPAQGCISGIKNSSDGSQWILVSGIGGQVSFEYHACFKVSDLSEWTPSKIAWGNKQGVCCAGKDGTGVGFEVVGPQDSGTSQVLDLHKVSVSTASQSNTVLGHVNPTDIDAAWTQIICSGCCVDQADGHVLIAVQGQNGATNTNYLAKLSSVNASVIWKTAMPNDYGGPEGGQMMQFSRVDNSRFNYISNQGGGAGVEQTWVNTSSGAIADQYTTGLSNLTLNSGGCASNDNLGTVLGDFNLTAGVGGPSLRNTTPSAFFGWALIYVEPVLPLPSSGNRRFLAEAGPIRVLA